METSETTVDSDDPNFSWHYSYKFDGTLHYEVVISLKLSSTDIESATSRDNATIDI